MSLVPRTLTKPTRAEWLAAARSAWLEVVGVRAFNAQLAVLWGQFAEECGRGNACWNWNVGNIRAFHGYVGDYQDLPGAWEVMPDGSKVVTGGAFRAYASLHDGIVGLLTFLRDNEPHAWPELMKAAPSAIAFVYGLKTDRYFTGEVAGYASTVDAVDKGFEREFAAELRAEQAPIPSSGTPTAPATPTSKSSQRLPAVAPPISPDDTAESEAAQACLEPPTTTRSA